MKNKTWNTKQKFFFLFILFVVLAGMAGGISILAKEEPVKTIDTIGEGATTNIGVVTDYYEEMLYLTLPADKKLYVSTDKEKNWDRLENLVSTGGGLHYTTFDISSILSNKITNVYFRTALMDTSTAVELQGLTAIKAKASGASIVVTGVPDGRQVEYRKGTGSVWKTMVNTTGSAINGPNISVSSGQVVIDFSDYTLKGANITFRLKATTGARVGKEVKCKVAKKANGPNIKVDGTKLLFSGFKAGVSEYRITDSGPYIPVADKTIGIEKLFGIATGRSIEVSASAISQAGISVPIQGGTVEIRTGANGKKPASRTKIVEVSTQAIITDKTKIQIGTMAQKTTTLPAIMITDASSTNPYEYTLLGSGVTSFDVTKQKWVRIKAAKQVAIKRVGTVEAAKGVTLLVRKATYTNKTTKMVVLASTSFQYTLQ